jgi:predicted transposase YdaD
MTKQRDIHSIHPFGIDPDDESASAIMLRLVIEHLGLKEEDDYMYQRGAAKAEARFQQEMTAQKRLNQQGCFTAIALLDIAHLTDTQIMTITGVSTEILHQIKKDLAAAPKKNDRLKSKLSAAQIAEQLNLPVNWVEKQL